MQLSPMILKEKYFGAIEDEIQRILNQLLFIPLTQIVYGYPAVEELQNVNDALLEAIRSGIVWYQDGLFKGDFSSKVTRELRKMGATYNKPSRSWSFPKDRLPSDIKFAQVAADTRVNLMRHEMISVLDNIDPETVFKISSAPELYTHTLQEMNKDIEKATAALTIVPTLSDAQRTLIADQWGKNLNLYISGWLKENILKLREEVSQHAFAGGRAEGLVKMLQEDYGTSKSKAKFLARQETSLLMSKFQQSRYADVGVTQYRWSTSHDERVRPDHKVLNGKVFSFDQPPITNRDTGARNNPGEDFNCRCIAIPVVF